VGRGAGAAQAATSSCEVSLPQGAGPAGRGAADAGSPAAAPAAASCPLGFGSSKGPKLGALHCIVCKYVQQL
jgi:hypothetical protein